MTWAYNKLFGGIILLISKFLIKVNCNLKQKYNSLLKNISEINCSEIPEIINKSIILLEDKRFYQHSGFDCYSIIRAFKNNLFTKNLHGASTIEQQLVRTITNERKINYKRKIVEIVLATLVSNKFSKEQLLNYYLNAYSFKNCTGISELSKIENYKIDSLTIHEVSEIISRVKYPSITDSNYIRYLKRVRLAHIEIIKAYPVLFDAANSIENDFLLNQQIAEVSTLPPSLI